MPRSDLIPMVGKQFSNWTVLERDIERCINRKTFYKCRCKCGTIQSVRADQLRRGISKSCGCLKKEKLSKRASIHGMTGHPLHNVWITMNQRCSNPNACRYERYGGRGIKVCDEWKNDFMVFYNWSIENGYCKGLTIDRKDNDGNYCPENCRYISNKKQQLNKSNNHYAEINGVSKTIKEWCDEYNIKQSLFNWRLRYGWKGKKLLKKSSKH